MRIRYALILVATLASLLGGCATSDEARLERLMHHPSWPRIEQIARAEVEKREKLLGRPNNAGYLPMGHKDHVWGVAAITATRNGDVQRTITLLIGDDGTVLAYKRDWEGE